MEKIPFVKYHGAGNDFIMIDDRDGKYGPMLTTEWVAKACHRHFGIGADGMILLQAGREGADFFMKYYNSDGRISSFCGNGGRCIAAFAWSLGINPGACKFLATDGWHEANRIEHGLISLSMNDINLIAQLDEKTFVLNSGSPHYVKFIEGIEEVDVFHRGHDIRYSPKFRDEGINVNFVELVKEGEIKIRTYERGVENETLACGTGVVASSVAAAHYTNPAIDTWKVNAQGGKLQVNFKHEGGQQFSSIRLIGPAEEVFHGEIEIGQVPPK